MSDRQLPAVTRLLINAKEMISNPTNWCRGHMRNPGGQRCAVGAALDADSFPYKTWVAASIALDRAAYALTRPTGHIIYTATAYNDSRTHADVMRLFDKAIEMTSGVSHARVPDQKS
jgi:hypothetical protein